MGVESPELDDSIGDLTGQVFQGGRYQLVRRLGAGGMGAVYQATDNRLHRDVALKILNAELVAHPTARRRMTQEAQAMARIEHPNVVRVIDVFDEGLMLVLVLELIAGGDLGRHIAAGGLPEAPVLRLMSGILAGLDAVHRAGIIHRDLKPGNVLLTASGQPKITDLGIARDSQAAGITRTGSTLGTPEYMSPEQVQGMAVDTRSDIYSAGILLYELLTGRLPFSATSEFEIASAHVQRAPDLEPLRQVASARTMAVVQRALAKDRAQRFASAADMDLALQSSEAPRLQTHRVAPQVAEVAARPPATPSAQTNKVAVLFAALAGAGAVAGLALTVGRSPPRAPTTAPPVEHVAPPAAEPAKPSPDSTPDRRPEPAAQPEPSAAPEPERKVEPSTVEPPKVAPPKVDKVQPEAAPAAPDRGDPTSAVTEYYQALNRGDLPAAYAHWRLNRAASYSTWKRTFGDNASCASVKSASLSSHFGDTAAVSVDVCVGDRTAGEVHRWGGSMDVEYIGGVWKMTAWRVGKRGLCSPDCSL